MSGEIGQAIIAAKQKELAPLAEQSPEVVKQAVQSSTGVPITQGQVFLKPEDTVAGKELAANQGAKGTGQPVQQNTDPFVGFRNWNGENF